MIDSRIQKTLSELESELLQLKSISKLAEESIATCGIVSDVTEKCSSNLISINNNIEKLISSLKKDFIEEKVAFDKAREGIELNCKKVVSEIDSKIVPLLKELTEYKEYFDSLKTKQDNVVNVWEAKASLIGSQIEKLRKDIGLLKKDFNKSSENITLSCNDTMNFVNRSMTQKRTIKSSEVFLIVMIIVNTLVMLIVNHKQIIRFYDLIFR